MGASIGIEITLILSSDAELRWRARRVPHEGAEETVGALCDRLEGLATDPSWELFASARDGETLALSLWLERDAARAWRPTLEAMMHAAVAEGGMAEIVESEKHPEPGEFPERRSFSSSGETTDLVRGEQEDALLARIRGESDVIRKKARTALDPSLDDAEPAIALWSHPWWRERSRAILALSASTDPSAVKALLRALDQPPDDLPLWPRGALGGQLEETRFLRDRRSLRHEAAKALGSSPAHVTPALVALFEREGLTRTDEESQDRLAALVLALGLRRYAALDETLIRVWHTHPAAAVRRASGNALFSIATPRALQALAADLGDARRDDTDASCGQAFVALDRANLYARSEPLLSAEALATPEGERRAFGLLRGISAAERQAAKAGGTTFGDPRWPALLAAAAQHSSGAGVQATLLGNVLRSRAKPSPAHR